MDMIVNSLYSNREVFLRELISNASDALDKVPCCCCALCFCFGVVAVNDARSFRAGRRRRRIIHPLCVSSPSPSLTTRTNHPKKPTTKKIKKVRFTAVTTPEAMAGREELEITVKADKEARTITIEDSGIGMTREQLLSNLGTIARSGTRKFMEAMKEAKGDANLIGQFGVGFYSAFLVADRVELVTKSWEEDKQWVWASNVGSHSYTVKEDESGESLKRGTR